MTKTPNLDIDLTEIPNLPFPELRDFYLYLYGNQPLKSTRRQFFIWRITNRLQELRFGGLDAKTRELLENMDEEQTKSKSLPIGSEMIRKYKGASYRLRIVAGGYEMDGEFYKSLSAVAFKITGRKISGKEFFGV